MNQVNKFLVINPGSTSTKLCIFENGKEVHRKELSHDTEILLKFNKATDQSEFRRNEMEKFLNELGYDIKQLTAIVARGGALPPIYSGAYIVNEEMIDVLVNRPSGQHASSTAAVIAFEMAKKLGIQAYIYDGNTADEMEPVSRLSGHPLVPRISRGHILNTKAVARMYAQSIDKRYEELTLILIHMGGGISIGLHKNGKITDILTDEDGCFSPERSGGLPSIEWARVCYSGKYSFDEACDMIRGKGGLTAYLGTNNARKVQEAILAGDEKAALVFDAMAYQVAKGIGGIAATVGGKIDGIIFTGGLANSKMLIDKILEKVKFLGPCIFYPGEFEMEALAAGITRVMEGKEVARVYREHEEVAV